MFLMDKGVVSEEWMCCLVESLILREEMRDEMLTPLREKL